MTEYTAYLRTLDALQLHAEATRVSEIPDAENQRHARRGRVAGPDRGAGPMTTDTRDRTRR
jgi:hypothetical protein